MDRFNHGANLNRDTAALCHGRAADDRARANGMDTHNGRAKFEASAANWEARAEMLGRLEASFEKRLQLDAAARRFVAAQAAA